MENVKTNLRTEYVKVAHEFASTYNYEVSNHIIDVMASVMMHRDKYQMGGSFVEAICSNNLDFACSRADSECINYLRLFSLVKRFGYLTNENI